MALLLAARSFLAFLALLALYVLGGLYQRILIWPRVLLAPNRRAVLVGSFMRGISRHTNTIVRLGGGHLRGSGSVPTDAPVLVLANHQSVVDITQIIVRCHPHTLWFVTRSRYGRFVPSVSLALRLLRSPLIDPHDRKEALRLLRKAGREQPHGILIFPEGHRSRDGNMLEFKTAGVLTLLRENRTPVYLAVTDGMWRCRRIVDFIFKMHLLDGTTDILGPFTPPEDNDALPGFVQEMRQVMETHIASLRSARGA